MLLFCQCFDVWRLLSAAEKVKDAATPAAAPAEVALPDSPVVGKAA